MTKFIGFRRHLFPIDSIRRVVTDDVVGCLSIEFTSGHHWRSDNLAESYSPLVIKELCKVFRMWLGTPESECARHLFDVDAELVNIADAVGKTAPPIKTEEPVATVESEATT